MQKNKKERLGSQRDFEEVKNHPWFADVDWDAVLKKEVEPPFKPVLKTADGSPETVESDATRESKFLFFFKSPLKIEGSINILGKSKKN